MRLRNQGESSNSDTYAPGGVTLGDGPYRFSIAESLINDSIVTAEEVRRLFGFRSPEGDAGQVPEPLSEVQGEVMFGYAVTSPSPLYTYDNPSSEVIKHTMRLAAERDSRLNSEEKQVYDYTRIELEFGPGFLLRAHP